MNTLVSKHLTFSFIFFFLRFRLSFKAWTFTCASCYSGAILHTERPLCNSHIADRNMHIFALPKAAKWYHDITFIIMLLDFHFNNLSQYVASMSLTLTETAGAVSCLYLLLRT